MMLSRRRLFTDVAAAAAVASLPGIAPAEPAVKAWSMNFPDWAPGVLYSFGDVVKIGDSVHYAMVPHYSEDRPSRACFVEPARATRLAPTIYYGALLSPVLGQPNCIREIVLQSDDQMATSRHWQPGGRVSPTTCLLTGHHVTVRLHSTRRLRDVGLVRGSPGSEYEVLWLIIPEDDPEHSVHRRYWQRALRYHEASRRKDRKRELVKGVPKVKRSLAPS